MIKINTTPLPDDREEIFSIDDVPYTAPREVPKSVTLKALRKVREEGEAAATSWIMDEVLGKDAVRALENCKTLREEDLGAVIAVVRGKVFGFMEEEGKG